jgi:hypothetical protein
MVFRQAQDKRILDFVRLELVEGRAAQKTFFSILPPRKTRLAVGGRMGFDSP